MHSVSRGASPTGIVDLDRAYTAGWVNFYERGVGSKPTDDHWRRFQAHLDAVFHGLCAYCEGFCKVEVDHFRPKSRFPKLTYKWSNWVMSCHECNHSKAEHWPINGLINPCDQRRDRLAESYFVIDLLTAEILPRVTLASRSKAIAMKTIELLSLNSLHQLRRRAWHLRAIREAFDVLPVADFRRARIRRRLIARSSPYSTVARAYFRVSS